MVGIPQTRAIIGSSPTLACTISRQPPPLLVHRRGTSGSPPPPALRQTDRGRHGRPTGDVDEVWRYASAKAPVDVVRWRFIGTPTLGLLAHNKRLHRLSQPQAALSRATCKSTTYHNDHSDVCVGCSSSRPRRSPPPSAPSRLHWAWGSAPTMWASTAALAGCSSRSTWPENGMCPCPWWPPAWPIVWPARPNVRMALNDSVSTMPCGNRFGAPWNASAAAATAAAASTWWPTRWRLCGRLREEAAIRGLPVAASRQLMADYIGHLAAEPAGSGYRCRVLQSALEDACLLGGGDAIVGVTSRFSLVAYLPGTAPRLVWLPAPQLPGVATRSWNVWTSEKTQQEGAPSCLRFLMGRNFGELQYST